MSYIAKKGKAAAKSATEEKKDFSKSLVPFKSGTTYKVRLASDEDFVEYYAASVFKVFYTTPVAPGNLYQKAAEVLYADAKAETDEKKAEEIKNQAYQIKPKARYLFAFINLEDGTPMIVDLSKAQAQTIIQSIEKYSKKISKVAFELSKQGQSTSTTVSLSPVLDMDDDLTDVERENFAKDVKIDDELYEKVLYAKDESEQVNDLQAFGFDVSRLGLSKSNNDNVTKVDDGEVDPSELF